MLLGYYLTKTKILMNANLFQVLMHGINNILCYIMGNFGSRDRLKKDKILLILLIMISSTHQSLRRRTSYRRIIQKNDNKIHQDGIIILKHDQVNLADGAWTTTVTATKPTLIGLGSWLENTTQTKTYFIASNMIRIAGRQQVENKAVIFLFQL